MATLLVFISQWLPVVEITIASIFVLAVLLQQRGASVGGAFGGDNFSATFYTRRGPELFLFRLSLVSAVLLVGIVALHTFGLRVAG